MYVLCQSVAMDACDVMINAMEFYALATHRTTRLPVKSIKLFARDSCSITGIDRRDAHYVAHFFIPPCSSLSFFSRKKNSIAFTHGIVGVIYLFRFSFTFGSFFFTFDWREDYKEDEW